MLRFLEGDIVCKPDGSNFSHGKPMALVSYQNYEGDVYFQHGGHLHSSRLEIVKKNDPWQKTIELVEQQGKELREKLEKLEQLLELMKELRK